MAIIAMITITALNSNATAAANRVPTLSALPRTKSGKGAKLALKPLGDVKSAAEIATPNAAPQYEPAEDFTEAEARVARLVTDKEVAAGPGLSVLTIEGYISDILSKKGRGNRGEIARQVFGRGATG